MKLLFSSHHALVDPTNGASRSVRDIMSLMAHAGLGCSAFSGALLDVSPEDFRTTIRGCLEARSMPYEEVRDEPSGGSILRFEDRGVASSVYLPTAPPKVIPDRPEGEHLLRLAGELMDSVRPDVLLTYGGIWVSRKLIAMAKARGIAVAFRLTNFAYRHEDLFEGVHVLVPSQYTADYYARTLSLGSTVIPCPLDWSRLELPERDPRYLTFVSPCPEKGGFWAARIFAELSRTRPDIPVLVVEGRGSLAWFCHLVQRLGDASRVGAMRTTEDPRAFYGVTRVLLVPSMHEVSGRVAQEALILRIPVLASRRGGLPETLRGAGTVLEIPPEYDERSTRIPSAEEVQPWLDALLALWDDPVAYASEQERCAEAALAYHPDVLAVRYRDFFEGLATRP